MKTIRVPQDFLSLTECMPKSNYYRKQRAESSSLPRLLRIKGTSLEMVSARNSISKEKEKQNKKIDLPSLKIKNRYHLH